MSASFAYLGIPGLLISVAGSTVLGIALLRRRYRPRPTGWLLATWLPTLVALSGLIALGAALLPMLWAWALAGRILRTDHPRPTTTELPAARPAPSPSEHLTETAAGSGPAAVSASTQLRRRRSSAPTAPGTSPKQLRRSARVTGGWGGDELLGVAVERPALEQLEVEVARATEDRAGPGPSGDDGEDRHLQAVDQAAAIAAQFSDRLACERSGTSDSSLSRATMSTASPLSMVASGQPRVSCNVEDTTVAGMRIVRTFHSSSVLGSMPEDMI